MAFKPVENWHCTCMTGDCKIWNIKSCISTFLILWGVVEDGMKSGHVSHCLSVRRFMIWQSHFTTSYLLSILHVWIVVSVCEQIIHFNGLFLSLLVLCRMVTTTSTARTLTVHRKWIRRWVSFTLCKLFYVYCFWFRFPLITHFALSI